MALSPPEPDAGRPDAGGTELQIVGNLFETLEQLQNRVLGKYRRLKRVSLGEFATKQHQICVSDSFVAH